MGLILGAVDRFPDGEARSVIVGTGEKRQDVIVLRMGAQVRGFVNACPHQGTSLETFPDKLMDEERTFLVCSTHGARFRPDDGYCVSGPCEGRFLRRLELRIENGFVVVE